MGSSGIGSPEFQKRLVEAAEHVVAPDGYGGDFPSMDDNNNDDAKKKVQNNNAQIKTQELRDHMARMLFQLNECRTFQEERKNHSPSEISKPFLDKLNKRMQSVSIPVPESPRMINQSTSEEKQMVGLQSSSPPKMLPSQSIDLTKDRKKGNLLIDFNNNNIEFVAS